MFLYCYKTCLSGQSTGWSCGEDLGWSSVEPCTAIRVLLEEVIVCWCTWVAYFGGLNLPLARIISISCCGRVTQESLVISAYFAPKDRRLSIMNTSNGTFLYSLDSPVGPWPALFLFHWLALCFGVTILHLWYDSNISLLFSEGLHFRFSNSET